MIGYFKAEPTQYARMSANGTVKRQGKGISGFYLKHTTSIELVSLATSEQPFSFQETTRDNQQVTFQGGLLYRINDPEKTFAQYDFAIDPRTKQHISDDADQLPEHILHVLQAITRKEAQGMRLEELLTKSDELAKTAFATVSESPKIKEAGIEVQTIYFLAPQPTPEIAKALGAEYRESLLQRADKAAYARRALAVESEKAIQQNELQNKTDLEEKRSALVALQGKNVMTEAQFRADAAKLDLEVFAGIDAEVLRAHALYQLGQNAGKIGNLTITTDVLAGLAPIPRGR